MSKSILKTEMTKGPLSRQMRGGGQSGRKKSSLIFALNLTALIDAFSMLVIFLLSNMTTDPNTINQTNKIQLPMTQSAEGSAMGFVIRIEDGKYFVDEKATTLDGLAQALMDLKPKSDAQVPEMQSIVIQADQMMSYDGISPILKAAGQAGFSKFKFAVIQNKRASL